MKNFVSLHNHDTFSVQDGLSRPIKFLRKAKDMGMTAFAQTNHGSMSGFFELYDAAKEVGIKPIFGTEGYFVDNNEVRGKDSEKPKHIIVLAKNKEGYKKLLKAQFDAVKKGFYYRPRFDWHTLYQLKGDVIVLSACIGGIVAKYVNEDDMYMAELMATQMKEIFGKDFYFEYVALERTKIYGPVWIKMYELAQKLKIKSVITLDTHYLNREDAELQDILHLVQGNLTMKDKKAGKGWIYDDRDLHLKTYDETFEIMSNIFEDELVKKFLKNTIEVADKIEEFEIYPEGYVFPKTNFSENKLKALIKEGMEKKAPKKKRQIYLERLNYEYEIIKKMGFLVYFWIVQDIVNWAKDQGIAVGVARGSAGGCLVSYLLNITEIDPIKFRLSFERFLNPTRKKMPDIDIDFQKSRRQEVLNYIKKYGEDNVSQIPNYVSLTLKSGLKDVMKVYGVPFQEANEFTKSLEDNTPIPKEYRDYYDKARQLEGNIRQYGKHAAGIIVTDKPIYEYLPVVSLKGNITAGIDGKTLVSKNFLKIDILGIEALDIIQMALDYIKKHEGEDVDIINIDLKDPKVYDLFQRGDTINIFQFETWNFRQLLQEAGPTEFRHLVQLNALNRPTPLSVGYHEEYIIRKLGSDYKVPKLLEPHLQKTYGLLLYQEQTNSIMADWLDLSDGEADSVRRDIEKIGFEEVMRPHKKKLLDKYDKEDVDEAFKELDKVVGYAFNKSHSCGYAYIAYQMAHLKCYYRKYFNLAVLNSETDEDKLQKIIDDCYDKGIEINTFDINEVNLNFSINKKGEITPGARILKGVGDKSLEAIIKYKPYKDFDDFMERAKSKTKTGKDKKIPSNILKILYENDFFENGFGKAENSKVKSFLDNKESKKAKKKVKGD